MMDHGTYSFSLFSFLMALHGNYFFHYAFKIVKSYLWDTMVNEKVGLEFGMNLFMSSSRI